MAARDDRLIVEITAEGEIKGASPTAARRMAAQRGKWRILPSVGSLMLLQKVPDETAPPEPSIALAGEISSPDSLTNILSFVHYAQWEGSLAIVDGNARKILFFRAGQLLAAASNLPEDRLGAMLVRFGQIKEEDLAVCIKEITPQRRLGSVLTEKGLLTSHQLYEAVRRQSEEIFHSTLLFWSGAFYFVKHLDEAQIPARLHLDTQNLLLEGLRRIDEMSFFRSKLPSADVVPTRGRPVPADVDLDAEARLLLKRIDGQATLAELSRVTHLGDFAVTKAAYGLLQAGFIEVRAPGDALKRAAPVERAHIGKDAESIVVAAYMEALGRLHTAMKAKGKAEDLRQSLDSFVGGSATYGELFAGVSMESNGALPVERLLANARKLDDSVRLDTLQRGLSEMLFFGLFVAGDAISRDEDRALRERVAEALEQIRKK